MSKQPTRPTKPSTPSPRTPRSIPLTKQSPPSPTKGAGRPPSRSPKK